MRTSENGKNLIKQSEGIRLEAYKDVVGIPTIGYGTTRVKNQPVQMGTKITLQEAEDYLSSDLIPFEESVNKLVSTTLNQNQFDALVSFVYNLGAGSLKSSTLLKKINANLFKEAALEFLKWNKAGGKVVPGLTTRRQAESKLFSTPV